MEEQDGTREVLFPEWEGTDKTGLTIEQTGEGEIFVKEVKDESPAGRSGRVHEGTVICKKKKNHSIQFQVFWYALL